MRRTPAIGRGDLVRALRRTDAKRDTAVVTCFGFEPISGCRWEEPQAILPEAGVPRPLTARDEPSPIPESETNKETQLRYLVPATFERFDPKNVIRGDAEFTETVSEEDLNFQTKSLSIPKVPPAPWSRVWPWLHHALGRRVHGRQIDLRKLVAIVASAKPLKGIPRRIHTTWAKQAFILIERRNSLAPFWDDFDETVERIIRLRGREGLKVKSISDEGAEPLGDSPVLVLGDMGRYSGDEGLLNHWLSLGRKWRRRGCRLSALLPCPRDRWNDELTRMWQSGCWNRHDRLPRRGMCGLPSLSDEGVLRREKRLERLLALISPAVRVEPGLLRLFARVCGGGVGLEFDAWNHTDVARTPLAMALYPVAATSRREAFALETESVKKIVLHWLLAYHQGYARTVKTREVDNLKECRVDVPMELREDAAEWRKQVNGYLFKKARQAANAENDDTGLFEWVQREVARASEEERRNVEPIGVGWALARYAERLDKEIVSVPKGIDPRAVAWVRDELEKLPGSETNWQLRQEACRLLLGRINPELPPPCAVARCTPRRDAHFAPAIRGLEKRRFRRHGSDRNRASIAS